MRNTPDSSTRAWDDLSSLPSRVFTAVILALAVLLGVLITFFFAAEAIAGLVHLDLPGAGLAFGLAVVPIVVALVATAIAKTVDGESHGLARGVGGAVLVAEVAEIAVFLSHASFI